MGQALVSDTYAQTELAGPLSPLAIIKGSTHPERPEQQKPSGGCGNDNLAKAEGRTVPPLCTSTPAPLRTSGLESRRDMLCGVRNQLSWQEEREEANGNDPDGRIEFLH